MFVAPLLSGYLNLKELDTSQYIKLRKKGIKIESKEATIKKINACSKKEVFQPHLPIRLPCYDLAPVTSFTLGGSLRLPTLGTPGFHGLTGGVCKVRERIHRIIADIRLLAIPASWSRVADSNLN